MKRGLAALLLQTAILVASPVSNTLAQSGPGHSQPPVARKAAHVTEIHGYKLEDNYFWLREKNNPEVIKYLEEENAYTDGVMKPDRKSTRLNSSHRL